MGRAVDVMDVREKNIHKVDVIKGIRWIKKAWEEMASGVIRNCWRDYSFERRCRYEC